MEYKSIKIQGYENYMIDTNGDVWSLMCRKKGVVGQWELSNNPKKIFKSIQKSGHFTVILYSNKIKKCLKIQRLVASHFIANLENKPQVNHKDGNPQNNNVENLYWGTQKENIADTMQMKRQVIPSTAKLNPEKVRLIRKLHDDPKWKRKDIAEYFNVDISTIDAVVKRRNWDHVK